MIWVVMGAGAALLFEAIVVRNVRRIRGRARPAPRGAGSERADA
ncbi:MAG: hypothetical protein R2734_19245 [Nocardioides sp.]